MLGIACKSSTAETVTYDGVGNPLNDGTWTYTWRHGRELSTMTNGTITVRNSYNPDGARIAKIVNRSNGSETHRYTYNGGKLVYDIIRINKEGTISNLTILMSYDESGRPFMITYANVSYYYLLNAQGDVVGIMNVSGDIMVEYTYDAWGNVLSITGPMADTMGQHNQLRYRGYVYDPETGLYFLNSRFYDPEKGRFINADVLVATGQGMLGNNMFAYCRNNPVNRIDIRGYADTAIEEEFDDDIEPHPHLPEGGGYSGGTTPIAGAPGGGSIGYGGTAGGNGGISGGGTGYGGNGVQANPQYQAPSGGGGVSTTYIIDGVRVDFGHGSRHIDATEYDYTDIEAKIAQDVSKRPDSYGHASTVTDFYYDGRCIKYSYYTREKNHINVGTYYFMDDLK